MDQLAGAAGTPLYLYDLDAVAAAYRRLEAAFGPGQVLYSVKANNSRQEPSYVGRHRNKGGSPCSFSD